jgi:hypothetical protein
VAAAATIGAVIGLGLRHGLALRPFASTGRALFQRLGIAGTAPASALVGLAMIASAIILLGVCFTVVAAPLRGFRLLGAAIVFGAIAWSVSGLVIPSILAWSTGAVLGSAQRLFIFSMLTVALVVGMRLARSSMRID